MKAIIGTFDSHEKAVEAVVELKKAGYPTEKLSVIGKADLIDNHIHVKTNNNTEKAEFGVGVVAGTILGVLTGVGIFAVPGLGFLYGAGALVGAFAGLDFGIIAGGATAIFTGMGIAEVNAIKYEKRLNEGKFIVFAEGDDKQVEQAQKILHQQNLHLELDIN